MDTSAEKHPAGEGLLDSGYVVSVLRGAEDMQMTLLGDRNFVGITVQGNPCGALLCCSERGALALVKTLSDGLERIWTTRKQEHDGSAGGPACETDTSGPRRSR